jgi:hypothetical protein
MKNTARKSTSSIKFESVLGIEDSVIDEESVADEEGMQKLEDVLYFANTYSQDGGIN